MLKKMFRESRIFRLIVDEVEKSIYLTDLDIAKGTQAIRAGILVGAGAEYNISGTTSMFFSLHYNLFITNMITAEKNEKYLRQYNSDTGSFTNIGAKSIPGSVSLTVGVLF